MDISVWEEPVRCLNKYVDEVVVFLSLDTALLETEVEVVSEKVFVLCRERSVSRALGV